MLVGSLYTMLWAQMNESKAASGTDDDGIGKDQYKRSAESEPEEQEQTNTAEIKGSTLTGVSTLGVPEL